MSGAEIAACHPWLEAELNASSWRWARHPAAEALLVTIHPSFPPRMPDPAGKAREYQRFVDDLRLVRKKLTA